MTTKSQALAIVDEWSVLIPQWHQRKSVSLERYLHDNDKSPSDIGAVLRVANAMLAEVISRGESKAGDWIKGQGRTLAEIHDFLAAVRKRIEELPE